MNQYDFDDSNYPRSNYVKRARFFLVATVILIIVLVFHFAH